MHLPPPLPKKPDGILPIFQWLLLGVALIGIPFVTLISTGLLRNYSVPTDGMKPAVSRGDRAFVEKLSYLVRSPHEGEIVVYLTDGLETVQSGAVFCQRIAGNPGDVLRISEGKLYANDNRRPLANLNGEIVYTNMSNSHFLSSPNETVVVPSGHYFLLGDNSAHSFDSRFLGFVPAKSITGRVIFRK